MSEPQYMSYPDLALSQAVFALASPTHSQSSKQTAQQTLQDAIREHKMAPLYHYLAHPTTGKLNTAGESGSSTSQPTLVTPSHPSMLRRTSSINASNILGVLGGVAYDSGINLPWDEALYEQLKQDNQKELDDIQKEEDEVTEQAGETEIQNARGKRAELYARIGDKDAAIKAFDALLEKTGILSTKIDIVLAIIRIGIFFEDKILVKQSIDRATALVESGGDWDRRNRLKAYNGLYLITIRAHNLAAPLLLDSLSTFTSTELCSYSNIVVYAVLAGSVSLPRRDFKTRVVDSPEVRAILGTESTSHPLTGQKNKAQDSTAMDIDSASSATPTPKPAAVNLTTLGTDSTSSTKTEPQVDFSPISQVVQHLYDGSYKQFFAALSQVEVAFLGQDRYLYEHRRWFVKEMRLRAYAQLLQSYKVVGLQNMASSFGVSVDWLDRFVSSRTCNVITDDSQGSRAVYCQTAITVHDRSRQWRH